MGDGMNAFTMPWANHCRVFGTISPSGKERAELDLAARIANAAIVKMMKQTN